MAKPQPGSKFATDFTKRAKPKGPLDMETLTTCDYISLDDFENRSTVRILPQETGSSDKTVEIQLDEAATKQNDLESGHENSF